MTTIAPAAARSYRSLRAAWIPLFALCLAFFVEMVDNVADHCPADYQA